MSEIKPFTGVDNRTILSKAVPVDTPFTLNIFPSEVCNFRCSYCAQSLGSDELKKQYGLSNNLMDVETIRLVSEQSKEFKHKYKLISMMGHGEPLCNKKLPEMIEILKKANITERIDIISNASLLTHEMSDALLDAGLDILRVSLQGITSEMYKNICKTNIPFETIYDNLSYFYKKSQGRCKLYVKTMDVSLAENETEKYYNMFENITDRMFIDKVKPVYDKIEYSDEQNDLSTDRYGNKHERIIVCPQPFYMLSVWTNGDITPCDALYKASLLGNVYNDKLSNMWLNRKHKDFCLNQLDGKRFSDECCSRCCAPDDVAHKEDILDSERMKLRSYFL